MDAAAALILRRVLLHTESSTAEIQLVQPTRGDPRGCLFIPAIASRGSATHSPLSLN